MAVMGRVRPGDAKAIELPGPNPLEPDVPDVARLVPNRIEDDAPGRCRVFCTVEQVEPDASGVPAEDGKVHPGATEVRPQGKRRARSDGLHLAHGEETFQFIKLFVARRLSGHPTSEGQLAYRCLPSARQSIRGCECG